MNFRFLFLFFTIPLSTEILIAQPAFFIKYSDNISRTGVEEIVATKRIVSSAESLGKLNNNFDVRFFAHDLGKTDDRLSKIIKVTFRNENDAAAFLSSAQNDYSIEYIQPANTYRIDYVPNDSLVNEQWALNKINAFDAWNITQGNDTILISVIDTGIDYLHPDLKDKIFINIGETGNDFTGRDKRSNNIDDDGNGFIDDWHGWDFTDRAGFPFDTAGGDFLDWDNDPMDQHFHGTFVAGITGAGTNNNSGIAGAAPGVRILNARAFDPNGFGDEEDAAAAILYSVQMGARVINMSWGDDSFSYVLRDVIRYAYSRNVVLVASAGNSNSAAPHYPSGYSEVISVGNSTEDDFVAGSSNYGSTLDLVAPGTSIISTALNNNYQTGNGTSFAAPHVSAAAGLILSLQNFTNEEIKQIIKSSADDIGEPGWDLRSGAGRLNLFRTLSVLAPAVIKINSPVMDFATNGNSVEINATVLSPYFMSFNLQIGPGETPVQWTTLIENGRNQFTNETISTIDVTAFADGVYTLRLIVFQNNGNTVEERTHFHIMRKSPRLIEAGSGVFYTGGSSTIGAEFYTDQKSIVRLYYKKTDEQEFRFITLDGFNTNNQFIKQLHYGFIPGELISPQTDYEVYYEAENLVGLKTKFLDTLNNSDYFRYRTDSFIEPVYYSVMDYNLPKGTLYEHPVNFLSDSKNEVLFDLFYTPKNGTSYSLYVLNGNTFSKFDGDSLIDKIPRAVGDFNSNGKIDLISTFSNDGFIDEQKNYPGFSFNNLLKDTLNRFHVVLAEDIDNDGNVEILADSSDCLLIYRLQNDLTLSGLGRIKNSINNDSPDSSYEFRNLITRNVITADLNNDGVKEIWFTDADGDLISYDVNQNSFTQGNYLLTYFRDLNAKVITKGDYDNDGVQDLAVIFSTNSIAPNIILLIFNFKNNQYNPVLERVFIDQSDEFIGFSFREVDYSLRLEDIDNDVQSELIVNIFPYTYIFKRENQTDKIIFFKEGTNNEYIFSGDLNRNGVKEIAFQEASGYYFYEFGISDKTLPPVNVSGFSIDSVSITLSWEGIGERFRIFKGTEKDSLALIDSVFSKTYLDNQVRNNTSYYYAIQAYDASMQYPYSNLSAAVRIYSHSPARVNNIENNSPGSLIVTFDGRVKTVINNLEAFRLLNSDFTGSLYPNSISPHNQYSYLLTFNENPGIGINYLVVEDIADYYNSPIAKDTVQFNVEAVEVPEEFFISSFEILSPFQIKLIFNSDVDEVSASDPGNYEFEPANNVSSVIIDNTDKKIVYLNLDGTKPVGSIGREYRLRATNLRSSGGLMINSGAGSYVVLTSFARDLSDVYVYPNPAPSGNEKITFANLPKRAKIIIFSLNGERIAEIEEKDGNGGVDFNLNYDTGEKISSGIYIYRIVMLDDSNNELEEKIGKFAVVR